MKPRFNHATHTLYLHESGKKQNPVIIFLHGEEMKNFFRDMRMVSPASFRRAFCLANDMTLPEGMGKVMTPTLFCRREGS